MFNNICKAFINKPQLVHNALMQKQSRLNQPIHNYIKETFEINDEGDSEIAPYLIGEPLHENSNKEIEEDIITKSHQSHKV